MYNTQGDVFKQKLAELCVSSVSLEHQISVPSNLASQFIAGKHSAPGNIEFRFGCQLRVSPDFWLNLHSQYDMVFALASIAEGICTLPPQTAGISSVAVAYLDIRNWFRMSKDGQGYQL